MSQVEPDTTEKVGKRLTNTSSVETIFPILSLNLVLHAYYSNALAGRSNLQQNTLGRHYCDFIPDLTGKQYCQLQCLFVCGSL